MYTAIISDIHSNLEALKAVLADIATTRADRIFCLGDCIGYGPNPRECLKLLRSTCDLILMGNHEQAILKGPANFTPLAAKALDWTASRLNSPDILAYLSNLPDHYIEGRTCYVHGSIKDPINEYVREADSPWMFYQLVNTLRNEFVNIDHCFVGHNHRAFLGTEMGYIFPHDDQEQPQMTFNLKGQKAYISIGSVGQPRDGDNRAAWVLFDGNTAEYHRVEYDWRLTAEKIFNTTLPKFLAERLEFGD